MGAVDLGERRLLPELGALAGPERADVGGESRLLLGRAVAVLEDHAVGRGRLVVHQHPHRGEREQGNAACGSCVEEHGAVAAAAGRRCTAEVEDKWTRAEQALAWLLTLTLTPTPTPTPTLTSTSTPTLTLTLTLTPTLILTPEP
eukprot:scaffold57517_cov31-Phaeocystis_antarctica.AAC.1